MEVRNNRELNIEKEIEADNILFVDLDGTLVDTNLSNYLSYKKAILSVISKDISIYYPQVKRFNRGILKSLIPNLTNIQYQRIIQLKEEYYKDYLPQTVLNNSLAEILIEFSKTNITVLVTNCREDRALMTLDYYGLRKHFSNFFFRQIDSESEKRNKFQNAILSLAIAPTLVVAYENEESEIADALDAGIQFVNPIIKVNK